MKTYLCILAVLIAGLHQMAYSQAETKPNIIFLLLDDLNDYTESLGGHPQSTTPNFNELESLGVSFDNAYCSSPKCSPSRTSMLTGKDLLYTNQYRNVDCEPFRDYFSEEYNNEEVVTMAQHFKDVGGYFTYGINKVYHCFEDGIDYDSAHVLPCEKQLSWNKYSLFDDGEDTLVKNYALPSNDGITNLSWTPIPNDLERFLYDYKAVDSATLFMNAVRDGELDICGRPFFITIGLRRPHVPYFIPEKYFLPDYCSNYFVTPLNLPYNDPVGRYPLNGVIMPPQPDTMYGDYFHLPETGLASYSAQFDSAYYDIYKEIDDLDSLPQVMDGLTEEERRNIMHEVIAANSVMGYLAAIKFLDVQLGRLLDSLEAHPDTYNNTIIIIASDNGLSLGEKRHWQKGTMWETDIHIPFIIIDLRAPVNARVKTSVSLLDIFPTLCSMTDVPYPLFADSSKYLDGTDLSPLLENPDLLWEKPSLSAYQHTLHVQLGCNPSYSVRNDRFHYIHLTSNGAAADLACDEDAHFTEDLLYEIGRDRTIDPNEWNNLGQDEDYFPVINYLSQWLPDSALYLQKTYRAEIDTSDMPCTYAYADTIHLDFSLFDVDGYATAPGDSLSWHWYNNATDSVYEGISLDFPLSDLPPAAFDSVNRLIWYLEGVDSLGVIRAFDMQYYFLASTAIPEISFSVVPVAPQTIAISDVNITGDYEKLWWDFGDGTSSDLIHPGPHTYPTTMTYTVTAYVQYTNKPSCLVSESQAFLDINEASPNYTLKAYPNPASQIVYLATNATIENGVLQIVDLAGHVVKQIRISSGDTPLLQIPVSDLPAGLYEVVIKGESLLLQTEIVITPQH